ncbi:MAG: GNAT family N-acetyltransferase [Anaerolineales bacterium]|nr:GNAT family N-acetyltransferase [Anaerolineales bacterium]
MKILESKRLILRHLEMSDLAALFALYQDPEMIKYIPDAPLTLAETKRDLEYFANGHPKLPELGLWATIHKETGQFIGRCGLLPWEIDGNHETEIAFMIDKPYWGQGLGTEVAQALLAYGQNKLGLTRMVCLIEDGNAASIRIAEKIGMAFEKEGRDEIGPFLLYTIDLPANP